jgi:hypothetical protein
MIGLRQPGPGEWLDERSADPDGGTWIGQESVFDALSTLLEIEAVRFGAIESEQLARGYPWLATAEWYRPGSGFRFGLEAAAGIDCRDLSCGLNGAAGAVALSPTEKGWLSRRWLMGSAETRRQRRCGTTVEMIEDQQPVWPKRQLVRLAIGWLSAPLLAASGRSTATVVNHPCDEEP